MLYIFTLKDKNSFFNTIYISTKEELIEKLIWNKKYIPELWSHIPDKDILNHYSEKELVETLYNDEECIAIHEIGRADMIRILKYIKDNKIKLSI